MNNAYVILIDRSKHEYGVMINSILVEKGMLYYEANALCKQINMLDREMLKGVLARNS